MTNQQTDRQAAVEALQRALTEAGVNMTGTGCTIWVAQHLLSRLEARGFTIVRKNTLDTPPTS